MSDEESIPFPLFFASIPFVLFFPFYSPLNLVPDDAIEFVGTVMID